MCVCRGICGAICLSRIGCSETLSCCSCRGWLVKSLLVSLTSTNTTSCTGSTSELRHPNELPGSRATRLSLTFQIPCCQRRRLLFRVDKKILCLHVLIPLETKLCFLVRLMFCRLVIIFIPFAEYKILLYL